MVRHEQIKVWDAAVRTFHWSLVVLFFVAYVSGDDGDTLHVYAGYGVSALVVFRIVWGVIGTKYARFTDFVYGPSAALRYLKSVLAREPIHYVGHNPLGGWMVVALLLSLIGTCWSGLELYAAEGRGPLAQAGTSLVSPALADDDDDSERERRGDRAGADEDEQGEDYWEDVHELLANFTLVLVFLHILGAVSGSVIHRENLVKAMITGFKRR